VQDDILAQLQSGSHFERRTLSVVPISNQIGRGYSWKLSWHDLLQFSKKVLVIPDLRRHSRLTNSGSRRSLLTTLPAFITVFESTPPAIVHCCFCHKGFAFCEAQSNQIQPLYI
jgi:hypothetical protein